MMRTGGPTSFCGGVLCVLAALAGPAHAQSTSAECTPRSQPIQRGLTVVKTERRDAQTTIYYFRSAAVGPDATPDGIVRARVVLPRRYASEPTRRFPVVYHLHGTNNSATTWTDADVEKYIVGDTPVILVMPDGGNYGFYTDHYGSVVGTTTQPPAWDTFHNLELVPWIDAHLRTTGRHAIAGSSMGGFGSMAYPERHPGLYDAAASLSGALDIELAGTQPVLYAAWGPCVWGNPVTDADNWHANNPTEHVDKLKGVSLYVSSGNGLPGEHDDLGSPPGTAPTLEVLVHQMTVDFLDAAAVAHIPVTTNLYGNGEHPDGIANSRHYDFDNMRQFLPQALAAMTCATHLKIRVRIPRAAGRIRSVRTTVAGRRVKTSVRGRVIRIAAPRRAAKVVITVRLRNGKTIRKTRTYRGCVH